MSLFYDRKADVSISYDRNSVTVRLYADNVFERYKECRSRYKDFYSADFIEMPIGTVTSDGYYYSIRGKQSVKEFITGEEPVTPEMFLRLLRRTVDVAKLAEKCGVIFSDVVFDYNCVFVQNGGKEFVFIYMPGTSDSAEKATAGDLLSVVFMNMDYDSLPQERYAHFKAAVDSLIYLTDPAVFAENAENTADEIDAYIESNQGFAKRLLRKLAGTQNSKTRKNNEDVMPQRTRDSDTVKAFVKADGGMPVVAMEKSFKKDETIQIKIGRDSEWADVNIDNVFVSRQHAELYIDRGCELRVKDMSLNGTFIGGERTTENGVYNIVDGDMIITVGENCEIELKVS